MGLDMYAFRSTQKPEKPIDFEADKDAEEIHYWRKHPNLHGWMQKLYVEKGGDSDEHAFNVVNLQLTAEDLDRLENDIKGNAMPETSGFFFGKSYDTEESRADDLEFVAEARQALAAGDTVFYTSWW